MKNSPLLSALSVLLIISGCKVHLKQHNFPKPIDTYDKSVAFQEKQVYRVTNQLYIDNLFDGARINDLKVVSDSMVSIFISPENEPINSSPWYAFRIAQESDTNNLKVVLTYPEGYKHRYWPNISEDGTVWRVMDSLDVVVSEDEFSAEISLQLTNDTTFIAAQPIISSNDVILWCDSLAQNEDVSFDIIGESRQGRSIPFLKIGTGKKTIVIFSRQHPPEVTGYFALQAFIKEILDNPIGVDFLENYALLIYPLLNPDGVDEGHWRHNAGGVDLNRDWGFYRQKEINTVANHVVNTINSNDQEVILGLDFHSTWYDVYYTTDRSLKIKNQAFTDRWLNYIEANIDGYKVKDSPSGLGGPVSKGWLVAQFDAPGITYEIGDNTPREFIKVKSKVAAEGMMKILLEE